MPGGSRLFFLWKDTMHDSDLNKWIEHLEKSDTIISSYSKSEWLAMAKDYRALLEKVNSILATLTPYKEAVVKEVGLQISTDNGKILIQGYEGCNMGIPDFLRKHADRVEKDLLNRPIVSYWPGPSPSSPRIPQGETP